MADGDGRTIADGIACGEVEFLENGFPRWRVVEEDLARGGADAGALCRVESNGLGGCAAVDEKEVTSAQGRHQGIHECRIGGPARALVIVYASNVRDCLTHRSQRRLHLLP